MTLPDERTRAVHNAREFLRSLLDPKQTPRIPKGIRRKAYYCLKHYPSNWDISMIADGQYFGEINYYADENSMPVSQRRNSKPNSKKK